MLSPGSRQKFKFCRVPVLRHSAKPASNVDGSYFFPSAGLAFGKDFAECRFLALGKEIFANKIFAERPLLSAALSKAFAECPQHSAKRASAVVRASFNSLIFLLLIVTVTDGCK